MKRQEFSAEAVRVASEIFDETAKAFRRQSADDLQNFITRKVDAAILAAREQALKVAADHIDKEVYYEGGDMAALRRSWAGEIRDLINRSSLWNKDA